jgi:hypothetical protein
VPVFSRIGSWERSSRLFEREGRRILALAAPLTDVQRTTKVLVRRPRGVEDSSRFWSVADTAEHLIIVGRSILSHIVALTHGRVPEAAVSIAGFKPTGALGHGAVAAFESFIAEYLHAIVHDLGDRRSRLRHPHPWFGPLDARQWHWLAGAHQGLHRRQVQRIVRGLLPRPRPRGRGPG